MLPTTSIVLVLCCVLSTSLSKTLSISDYLLYEYNGNDFNHVTQHRDTADIYIGAKNSLTLLTNDFEFLNQSRTCPADEDCENINKVLVIDYRNGVLITCGGGNEGQCEMRSLDNLKIVETETNIVALGNQSAVGFIANENDNDASLLNIASDSKTLEILSTRNLRSRDLSLSRSPKYIRRDNFVEDLIEYVTGFQHENFNYFISNRKGKSQISRFCSTSGNLDTYSEIYLRCKGTNGEDYKIVRDMKVEKVGSTLGSALGLQADQMVFYGIFSNSTDQESDSALCLFTNDIIENGFFKAVNGCYTRGDSTNLLDYVADAVCSDTAIFIEEHFIFGYYCVPGGLHPTKYSKGIKNEAAFSQAVLELPGTLLTSVSIAVNNNNTVAFLGTQHGQLIKAHIINNTTARVYETLTLDKGYPVKADSFFDATSTELTILTENKLLRIQVESCKHYTTCNDCVGINDEGGDPLCGWCTLENRCTLLSECSHTTWIPSGSPECIAIVETAPAFLSITESLNTNLISLAITQLPADQNYTCLFGGTPVKTDRSLTNQLVCGPIPEVPVIPEGQVEVSVTLSVNTRSGVQIVSTEFPVYNCSAIKSCSMCVASRFECAWCVLDNVCRYTNTSSTPCSNSSDAPVHTNMNCPQLDFQPGPELLHSGKNKRFLIEAKNLPDVSDYICVIDDDEDNLVRATRINNGSVICNSETYEYDEELQEKNITIRVAWDKSSINYIDNQWIVTLYKCLVDRPDCSRCLSPLTTRPELNCTWCNANTDSCIPDSDCILGTPNTCPAPVVNEIVPSIVPTSSSDDYVYVIELTGQDLGQSKDDLIIHIGGKKCEIIDYSVGQSVSCAAPPFADVGSRIVDVTVNNVSSPIGHLEYQTPVLMTVTPLGGIMAGGTAITIRGENLIFQEVSVKIGNVTCNITSKNNSEIKCITGAQEKTGCWKVVVTFGNVQVRTDQFCYRGNPEITKYSPTSSIQAGGRAIRVSGINFQYVQKASIRVAVGSSVSEEKCTIRTNETMFCNSPVVKVAQTRRKRQTDQTKGVDSVVTFTLDGLSIEPSQGVTYFPDPVYITFKNSTLYNIEDGFYQLRKNETFILLYGKDLTLASTVDDVTVFAGDTELNVTRLEKTYVNVSLPDYELTSTLIKIRHNNLRQEFGNIRYLPFDFILMLVIILSLIVFIIVITGIAVRYIIKSRRIHNEVNNIRLEMEELEKTVKDEARQAIADLALGLTDITEDLKGVGMPFLSQRDYACSMLFTGFEIVPDSVEIDERDEDQVKNSALLKFSKLLMNRQFLLAFIRMINNNRQITIREKGNFASLLTVSMIVENKLEFMTDILEILLKEYIEDHMYSKKAKQVLIRNETVTEKLLSNWIALSMYNYLKYHAAFPLYLLYQAIKSRIKMGPVDAVTNHSTYSLSIDHILPSGIEIEEITIVVMLNDEDGEQIEVKVLTCDSISQVKMKVLDAMYKNRPYTQRPKIEELDLEWRNGKSGHLVLKDKEIKPLSPSKWQKINTLDDLGVKDRSTMALVKKSVDNSGVELISPTSPSFSKSSGYQNVVIAVPEKFDFQAEEGISYYHLVKEDDLSDIRDRSEVPKEFKRGQTIQYKRKKMIKEIHFPRLVSTKETIQEYVDNMFKAIMKTPSNTHKVPLAIKFLFDLFDKEGSKHEVDNSVLKTWKNNSFLARFWVQVITHPNFIFDIAHITPVDVALDIISRTFLDSCSAVKIKFTKESPVNRLLYTKEIESYRPLVDKFYSSVRDMPDYNCSEFVAELNQACQNFSGLFSKSSTLFHLHSFAEEHSTKLFQALNEDEVENHEKIIEMLKDISVVMNTLTTKNGHM